MVFNDTFNNISVISWWSVLYILHFFNVHNRRQFLQKVNQSLLSNIAWRLRLQYLRNKERDSDWKTYWGLVASMGIQNYWHVLKGGVESCRLQIGVESWRLQIGVESWLNIWIEVYFKYSSYLLSLEYFQPWRYKNIVDILVMYIYI
jgi:hypothetical protein